MPNGDNKVATTSGASAPSEILDHKPHLLKSEQYADRFQVAQSGMHKSLLILIGLVAFWLAIENTYGRYVDVFDQTVSLRNFEARRNQLVLRQKARPASAEDPNDGPLRSRVDQRRYQEIQVTSESRERLANEIATLRRESVDLSIAGTKLPSQLSIAPSLWLAALACWLFYVSARRASAYRNLAAYYEAIGQDERAFGAAGEGSMWLAPLPANVNLGLGGGRRIDIARNDLLSLIGWSNRTERYYRFALFFLFAFVCFMILRILLTALELTSDFAVAQKFAREAWRMPGTLIPMFFTAVNLCLIFFLIRRGKGDYVDDTMLPSKRTFIGGGAAFVAVGAVWYFRSSWLNQANQIGVARTDPNARASSLRDAPRFLTSARKEDRRRNHFVVHRFSKANTLVYSNRWPSGSSTGETESRRSNVAIHYANAKGEIRFFSAAKSIEHIKELPSATAVEWARRAVPATKEKPEDFPLNYSRLVAWEVAALDRVSAKDVNGACDILLAAVLTSIPFTDARPANLRILDLLAGLAVRYEKEDPYFTEMKKLVAGRIPLIRQRVSRGKRARGVKGKRRDDRVAAVKVIANPLVGRLQKWNNPNSKWRRRWANKSKPVWWHHPFETREFETTRTRQMLRPVKNPETRQKPVRIA